MLTSSPCLCWRSRRRWAVPSAPGKLSADAPDARSLTWLLRLEQQLRLADWATKPASTWSLDGAVLLEVWERSRTRLLALRCAMSCGAPRNSFRGGSLGGR